jgi:hypothetical protein
MKRIEETLVTNVGRFAPENVVWFAFVCSARWAFIRSLRKYVVCDAHFHVVGFAGKNHDGFVLCLPTKPRDRSVIAAAIRHPLNPQFLSGCRCCVMARQNLAILNSIQNSQAVQLQRNAKSCIAVLEFLLKIGRRQCLRSTRVRLPWRKDIGTTNDCK